MEKSYYIEGLSAHVMVCTQQLYSQVNETSAQQWLFVTNEVLYFIFPVIISLALVCSLLNSIVSAKMTTDSHECYLVGFNISSFMLILVSAVIELCGYAPFEPPSGVYTYMNQVFPYLLVGKNWCFYTCSWLLITAAIERMGHSLCGRWHASFGRVHGILASLLIVVVCFVCTLPQYWEYQTATVWDKHPLYETHNCSRLVIEPVDTTLREMGGYVDEYEYYHWVLMVFSIAIPYLVLPIMIPAMCCIKMHTYSALNGNGHISTYADDYVTKDYMQDEKTFNRLISSTICLYLILSGPRNAVKLLHEPPLFIKLCADDLMAATLQILFDVIFYLLFIILFFFNLCCCAKFRASFKSMRCKCCCGKGAGNN